MNLDFAKSHRGKLLWLVLVLEENEDRVLRGQFWLDFVVDMLSREEIATLSCDGEVVVED